MPLRLSAAVCLIGLLTLTSQCFAQRFSPGISDSANTQALAMSLYMKELGQAIPVLQGVEWTGRGQKTKGHPFFGQATPFTGSVRYHGLTYPGLALQYDLYAGALLILPENDGLRLEIPRHKLDRFVLDTLEFIRPGPEAPQIGLSDTVFYRVVYRGPTTVLARHRKDIRDRPGEDEGGVYEENIFYYMWSGAAYEVVDSEKQLLSLKGHRNRALRKQLSDRNIRFRKNTEAALVTAAVFYDQLK